MSTSSVDKKKMLINSKETFVNPSFYDNFSVILFQIPTRVELFMSSNFMFFTVAANARGPPTRTKKGKRPSDNPDIGLPSGKDIPDGRRFVPPAGPRAAPVPPARVPAGAPAPAPVGYNKPLPPAAARPPVPALPAGRPAGGIPPTRTRAGKRPAGRMGPAYGFAPPAPVVPKNPPVFANPWLAAPVAPVAPVVSCDAKCGYFWSPVCSVYGNTYDNDCRLACR